MAENPIAGPARVIDGDTLEIAGRLIHLHGIDAPETGQVCAFKGQPTPCGHESANLLRRLTEGKEVVCRKIAIDDEGDVIAKCQAGWRDLGAEMVTMGMAVAWLRQSDDYLRNYREARGTGIGIFAGEFIEPERWRAGERHPVETTGGNVLNK